MKKLSILIPVYNSEKYLEECFGQLEKIGITHRSNIEIIIVNDGSTDQSRKLCDAFAQKYPNVTVFHKKNEGVSVARNLALDKSNGDFIMFLDADDYFIEKNWNLVDSFLNSEKIIDFVAFSYQTLYENGEVKTESLPITGERTEELQIARKLTYASSKFNTCWGKIFCKKIIEKNSIRFIPGMKTGEDAMFVMEYMKYCKTVCIYNQPILHYRQVEESAMHKLNIEQKFSDFQVLYDFRRKMIKPQDPLFDDVNRESFSVITNLMLQMAWKERGKVLRKQYNQFLKRPLVQSIIRDVNKKTLSPVYKYVEYILMKHHWVRALTYYFTLKAGRK